MGTNHHASFGLRTIRTIRDEKDLESWVPKQRNVAMSYLTEQPFCPKRKPYILRTLMSERVGTL